MRLPSALAAPLLLLLPLAASAQDPASGKMLYETYCGGCHYERVHERMRTDVRDLADFVKLCVEQRTPGRYNAANPPGAVTMGDLLDTAKQVTRSDARYTWVDARFVEEHKLLESGELPIWAPNVGEYGGIALVNSSQAVAKGMRFRDLTTTVTDTLAWHNKRPADQQKKLRAGLTAEREAELLKLWHAKHGG